MWGFCDYLGNNSSRATRTPSSLFDGQMWSDFRGRWRLIEFGIFTWIGNLLIYEPELKIMVLN